MAMRKILLCMMAVLFMASCGDDGNVIGTNDNPTDGKNSPSTEVYVQGKSINVASTRATAGETEKAYFYIRIDNTAPGLGGLPNASSYFPQTRKGESVFADANSGLVDLSYPYFKTSTHYSSYVYDTTGEATVKALTKIPTLEDLVSANRNSALNLSGLNLDDYKIIWYIVKKYDGIWHVDGVLTKKTTTDASEILPDLKDDNKDLDNSADTPTVPEVGKGDGNVEVDIHQQEHSTWDEIKTSIHVRDLVDGVTVEIPLEYENVAESDDFAIRTYDFELESKVFINGHEYSLSDTNPIKVNVEHQAKKVVITVSAINKDYITALRKEYGDGITVEVHTYAKGLTKAEVWTRLKQSTVKVIPSTYDGLIFKGATSAYFPE